ncbi:MAG: c-type cytochrome [Gallionella sp.]|nr:c-type cytochrome [Gallionella sp.]
MLSYLPPLCRSCLFVILALATSLTQASEIKRGKELYNTYCADCHGATGISVMQDAPNFAKNESLVKSDFELYDAISKGNNAMPLYQGILSDQEILDVITFIRTLN